MKNLKFIVSCITTQSHNKVFSSQQDLKTIWFLTFVLLYILKKELCYNKIFWHTNQTVLTFSSIFDNDAKSSAKSVCIIGLLIFPVFTENKKVKCILSAKSHLKVSYFTIHK